MNANTSPELNLKSVVESALERIVEPDPEPYQMSSLPSGAIPFRHSSGYTINRSGRIEFSSQYDSRRLRLPGFEVVYVMDMTNELPSVYVDKLVTGKGVIARTKYENFKGQVFKKYKTPPFGIHDGPSFGRPVGERELPRILSVLDKHDIEVADLEDLTTLTRAEERLLNRDKQREIQSRENFRRDLQLIEEAERQAVIDSRGIILG